MKLTDAWKDLVPNERRDAIEPVHNLLTEIQTRIPEAAEDALQEALDKLADNPRILEAINNVDKPTNSLYDKLIGYLANPRVDLADYGLLREALTEVLAKRTSHISRI